MNKFNHLKLLLKACGFVLFTASISCVSPAASQQSTISDQPHSVSQEKTATSTIPEVKTEESPQTISSVFVREDTLSDGDNTVAKLNKSVQLEQTEDSTEVSYAVLKRKGKVLAKFDGVYSGIGNATDFGLFSFLGNDAGQLVVSQTIPRGGRHWVVDLKPDFRVIYDSADYAVGREDLSVLDIDKDGRFEILQEDIAFYGFDNFSMAETPLPSVIFKYDEKAGKYLPANHHFKEYALKNIESRIAKLTSENFGDLSERLDITLQYIYAGEEQKAWTFFDKEYKNADKEDVKSRVKAILRKQPVYKFIYGKSGTKQLIRQ